MRREEKRFVIGMDESVLFYFLLDLLLGYVAMGVFCIYIPMYSVFLTCAYLNFSTLRWYDAFEPSFMLELP